jgi:D-3-phosphoglycerate dehydrogenase / 2-oxoglutarate reductase
MKVTILDDWFDTLRTLPSFAKLAEHDVTVWTDHVVDEAELAERLSDAEVIVLIRERTRITGSLLDRLPKLRLISQRSVYPHIDVPGCTRNRVLLCSNMHADTPSYAAAELTWAILLAAARRLPEQFLSLKSGRWIAGMGHTLRGKTLGIYGWGRIGVTVAGYGRAFGMNVLVWGSGESRKRAAAEGWAVASDRDHFFRSCDALSLHLRLVPATRGIVTLADLASMKPSAILVNTSRAGLIESGALLAALDAGCPGMAAIDVFDTEPLTNTEDPLINHPHVVATPHIGYVTVEEFDLQFSDVFDQINAYADGASIHMINPEVLDGRSGGKYPTLRPENTAIVSEDMRRPNSSMDHVNRTSLDFDGAKEIQIRPGEGGHR